MSNLVLLRHAESDLGDKNRYSGTLDTPLSSKGIVHAMEISSTLPQIKWDVIYTSALIRTIQTALIYIANTEITKSPIRIKKNELEKINLNEWLPIVEIPEINERNYGILQTLEKKEIEMRYTKEMVFGWRRGFFKRPPEGESFEEVVNRVIPFYLTEILPMIKKGNNILVVAHQNSLRALYYHILEVSKSAIEQVEFDNCAIMHFTVFEDKVILSKTIGDVRHCSDND